MRRGQGVNGQSHEASGKLSKSSRLAPCCVKRGTPAASHRHGAGGEAVGSSAAALFTPPHPAPLRARMGRHAHSHTLGVVTSAFCTPPLSLTSFLSADPWAPARGHSSQLTPPNAENSRHTPEVLFYPVVGLAALSQPLMSHGGLLSAQGHPTQALCGLRQQLHPPQG